MVSLLLAHLMQGASLHGVHHILLDVLEQFNAPPKPAAQVPASSSAPSSKGPPSPLPPAPPTQAQGQGKNTDPFAGLDDDFARELTRGMESLFRDIAQGAGLDDIPDLDKGGENVPDEEREKAFKAAWEAMLVEGMNGSLTAEELAGVGKSKNKASEGSSAPSGSDASAAASAGTGTDSFQENIRKAMEKLKESDRAVRLLSSYHGPATVERYGSRLGRRTRRRRRATTGLKTSSQD